MKKSSLVLFLAAICLIISLAACGSKEEKKDTDSSGNGKTEEQNTIELSEAAVNHADDGKDIIGISMPAIHLERWVRDGSYLQKEFIEAGYEVDVRWADNKIDTQQRNIHELINLGADILLIAAVDGTALSDVLEEAKAADIPVIAYDRIIESDSVDYYVSFDSYKVGQLEGEYIRDTLDLDHANGNTYNMEIVSGYSADKNADGYYYGAHDLLKPYIEAGTLIIPSGEEGYAETETFQWSTEYANQRMCGLLSSFYSSGRRLDAVLCANDSAAIGVAQALESDYRGKNQVLLTGQDGDEANLKNIIDGKQSMTVYKCLPHETEVMFDVTAAFMKGEQINESLIEKEGWDFDVIYTDDQYSNGTSNMKAFILTPITITKDNIQSELIDKGFYVLDKDGYPKAAE